MLTGMGSACMGGPCTGHLLLRTELYQVCGVPRRIIRSVWKTHPCPWGRSLPSSGACRFGDVCCSRHTPASKGGTGFYLEQC